MKKNNKPITIFLFDSYLDKFLENKQIENYISDYGIQNFLDTYFIRQNIVDKIKIIATSQGLQVQNQNHYTCKIYFKENPLAELENPNAVLEKLIDDANIRGKFFKEETAENIFYIQKIFAFDKFKTPVPEINLEKPKTRKITISL